MSIIMDMQGFKTDSNQFIPKEIAILDGKRVQTFLFRSPFPFYDLSKKEMKQVDWIERNRNIYWREGVIPFANYTNVLAPFVSNKCIYVKGEEKKLWVQEMFETFDVVNLENFECPNFNIIYSLYEDCNDVYKCMYHTNICALKNVLCLNKWCIDNKIFQSYDCSFIFFE